MSILRKATPLLEIDHHLNQGTTDFSTFSRYTISEAPIFQKETKEVIVDTIRKSMVCIHSTQRKNITHWLDTHLPLPKKDQ